MDSTKSRRELIAVLFAALVLAASGCGRSSSGEASDVTTSASDRLVGSWEVTFHPGDGSLVRSAAPIGVRGTLIFVRGDTRGSSFPGIASPINYGLYDVDFTPFGFDTRDDGSVPGMVGHTSVSALGAVPDSIFILVGAERRGMSVLLQGELRGSRVEGTWITESPGRAGIAERGSFTMTRQRETDR